MKAMIVGAIVVTALAIIAVYILLRKGSVDPKTWAERHGGGDDGPDEPPPSSEGPTTPQ